MFTFNGRSNNEFNLKVVKDNHLSKFKKRVELISVPGRTGDLLFDDGSKENFNLTLEVIINSRLSKDLVGEVKKIEIWLDTNDYVDLIYDDGIKFKAYYLSGLDNLEEINDFIVTGQLVFTCKPY